MNGFYSSFHQLDNVERPSWQAQISGRKTWHLFPPPECESVCKRMLNVTIEKGEIGKHAKSNRYMPRTRPAWMLDPSPFEINVITFSIFPVRSQTCE